ncbi:MAG: hypothetical protein JXN59_12710, partial [Anaerolineae bacterium]|nr:hypothetical protein [Anaerolineae bacterium]
MTFSIRKSKYTITALALAGLAVIASLALLSAPVQAQADPTPTAPEAFSITFSGPVESLGPRFIVVNGLLVDMANAVMPQGALQLGSVVTVVGNLQNNMVTAALVQPGDDDGDDLDDDDTATPAPSL